MNEENNGRDQRDYIQFRRSEISFRNKNKSKTDGTFTGSDYSRTEHDRKLGRLSGPNRFGEENIHHDSYQDDQYKPNYDPTYEDEFGMKHPYEHGGEKNRWSDDLRSESSRENHIGKGPKGYQRRDERIREEACEILTVNGELDASGIEVEVIDRNIVLKGEVNSRYEKRLAENLLENILGVEDVRNQLKIKKEVEGWIPNISKVRNENSKEG